jgi:type II secretory pathway component GspD/PulD (secretin)
MRILRSRFGWTVLLSVLVVSPPDAARATSAEPFSFENTELSTVVKHIGGLTGLTFLFDPDQVKGRIRS